MKIAWFTDLNQNSISYLFTTRALKYFNDIEIFSSEKSVLLNFPVKNYLTYECSEFDLNIFLIADSSNSSFVYDLSQLYPGIRLIFDNTFNNLKFGKISHITNGIVFDELLKKEGYEDAFSIATYHMRGWSLEPYKKLFPFYFKSSSLGVDLDLSFPLEIKAEIDESAKLKIKLYGKNLSYQECIIRGQNIELTDNEIDCTLGIADSLSVEVINAIEHGIPFIFFNNHNYFDQIQIRRGIYQDLIFKELLNHIISEKFIISELTKNIVSYANKNRFCTFPTQILNICQQRPEILNSNSRIENIKLVNSIENISTNIMDNFIDRFNLVG